MPMNLISLRSVAVLAFAAVFAAPVQAATLLHSYTFATDASDGTGTLDGTLLGAATVAGHHLTLPGALSYVQLSGFAIPGNNFSIALWVKGGPQGFFTEFISQNNGGGNGMYIGTDNTGVGIRLGDQLLSSGVNFIADDQFHHYALTTNGSGTRFYIDGSLVGAYGVVINQTPTGTPTRFGRQFDPHLEVFVGSLDDIFIYSGALTPAEVNVLATSRTTETTQAPEPASLALVGSALAGLVSLRRRRR